MLLKQQDFYDVTKAYLKRAFDDNVVRAEVFLGPQSFTDRTPLAEVMEGILGAIVDAKREFGIDGGFIVSTHRHRTEKCLRAVDFNHAMEGPDPWHRNGGPAGAQPALSSNGGVSE